MILTIMRPRHFSWARASRKSIKKAIEMELSSSLTFSGGYHNTLKHARKLYTMSFFNRVTKNFCSTWWNRITKVIQPIDWCIPIFLLQHFMNAMIRPDAADKMLSWDSVFTSTMKWTIECCFMYWACSNFRNHNCFVFYSNFLWHK